MKTLKIILPLLFLICSCDNRKELLIPRDINNEVIKTKGNVEKSIEDKFRIIIVGGFKEKIMMRSTYYHNNKKKFIVPPSFHSKGSTQKASYFNFPDNVIPNNFMIQFWNKSAGLTNINLEKVIFKYKSKTKVITANEFKDNFVMSNYLNYDEHTKILTVKNHDQINFRAAFYPKKNLIDSLKEFTNHDGFKEIDKSLINSPEYARVLSYEVLVTINMNIKEKDKLTLFYNTGTFKGFRKQYSDFETVEPGNKKEVNFNLDVPFGENLSNLRFDYGSVDGQEIQISSLTIKKDTSKIVIRQDEFSNYFWSPKNWNLIIDEPTAKYGTKRYKEKIEPKLIGSKQLTEKLRNL